MFPRCSGALVRFICVCQRSIACVPTRVEVALCWEASYTHECPTVCEPTVLGWGIRNRGSANRGRIRVNPFSLRIGANCDSEPQELGSLSSRAIRTISRSLANPGQNRANPFSLQIREHCECPTQLRCLVAGPLCYAIYTSLSAFPGSLSLPRFTVSDSSLGARTGIHLTIVC